MSQVTMYTTAFCPYCVRAKQLLKNRGVEDIQEIRVDQDAAQRARMMEITGQIRREAGNTFLAVFTPKG